MLDRPGNSSTVADLDVPDLHHDLRATSVDDSSLLCCDRPHYMDEEQGGRHEPPY